MPRPPTTDHQPDEAEQRVQAAAQWLLGQPGLRSIVGTLRENFGLSSSEAVDAIRKAERLRRGST